jgi:hypothetical protein
MMGAIASFVKGLLPAVGTWIIYAAAAALIASSSAWVTHRVDTATLETLKREHAEAQTEAVAIAKAEQAKQDDIALNAAVAEATAQQKIEVRTVTIQKEITKYVSDTAHCITFGLIRVLDARVLGVDPADLALPAGQSDDACAPVTATALADSIVANYGAAVANAKQLNDLEATIAAMIAAAAAPSR